MATTSTDLDDSHTEVLSSFLELNHLIAQFDQKVRVSMQECDQSRPADVEALKAKVEGLRKEQEELKKRSCELLVRFCQSDLMAADTRYFEALRLGKDLSKCLDAKREDELGILAAGIKGFMREGGEMNEKANWLMTELDRVKSGREIQGSKNVARRHTESHSEGLESRISHEGIAERGDTPESSSNMEEKREISEGHRRISAEELNKKQDIVLKNLLHDLKKLNGQVNTLNWTPVAQAKQKFEALKLNIYEKLGNGDAKPKETQKSSSWDEERQILTLTREWVSFLDKNCCEHVINLLSVLLSCEQAKREFQSMRCLLKQLLECNPRSMLPAVVINVAILLEMPELGLDRAKESFTLKDAVMDVLYHELRFPKLMEKTLQSIQTLALILTASTVPKAESSVDKFVLAATERALKTVEEDLKESEATIIKFNTKLKELDGFAKTHGFGNFGFCSMD